MQKIDELEKTVSDLQARRADVAREEQAARAAEKTAHDALVAGTGAADDAATARARADVLRDAGRELEKQIAGAAEQLTAARALDQRTRQVADVVAVIRRGEEAKRRFEMAAAEIAKVLKSAGAAACEALADVERESQAAREQLAALAGVQPHKVFSSYGIGYDDPDNAPLAAAREDVKKAGATFDFLVFPDNALSQASPVANLPYGALIRNAIAETRQGKHTARGDEAIGGLYIGGGSSEPALWPGETPDAPKQEVAPLSPGERPQWPQATAQPASATRPQAASQASGQESGKAANAIPVNPITTALASAAPGSVSAVELERLQRMSAGV